MCGSDRTIGTNLLLLLYKFKLRIAILGCWQKKTMNSFSLCYNTVGRVYNIYT